jgi:hypothetical protein
MRVGVDKGADEGMKLARGEAAPGELARRQAEAGARRAVRSRPLQAG